VQQQLAVGLFPDVDRACQRGPISELDLLKSAAEALWDDVAVSPELGGRRVGQAVPDMIRA